MTVLTPAEDMLTVAVATPSDGLDLTQILTDSYRRSSDFTMQSEQFFLDNFKERSAVLTCRVNGVLVGTMRADLISSPADLAYEDEGFLMPDMVPALLLCRAATLSDRRARGVNSILRAYCIEAALKLSLRSLVGEVYRSAPRTRLMAELGYSFYPLKATSDAVRTYQSECFFAHLDLGNFGASALSALRTRNAELKFPVRWVGPSLAECLIRDEGVCLRQPFESDMGVR
jgi:hypothetical protein